LGGNQLTGTIPPELGNLINLEYIALKNNELSGCFDENLYNLCGQITDDFLASWPDFCNTGAGTCLPCRQRDSLALVVLYNSTDGANWTINWDLAQPMDTWYGVMLNEDECVTCIDMDGMFNCLYDNDFSGNNLSGSIPPEIGDLTNLTYLSLGRNQLIGGIPPEIGNLTDLTGLVLDNNQLTDSIPPEIGNLINLISFDLDNNQLTGSIPPEINLSNLCNELDSAYNINSIISDGNNFNTSWEDFCNIGAGTCDLVWPGDYNYDGTANEIDALYWGLAFGNQGSVRPNATTFWQGQQAPNWQVAVQGINGKHQDGDGNDVIDRDDLQVLALNFGRMHTFSSPPLMASAINYRLERIGAAGGSPVYDLYIEDGTDIPVEAHGLAFTIDFGALPVTGVQLDTTNSPLAPSDTLKVFNEAENRLHIALTRTDRNNQICDSPVLRIVILENLPTDTTEFEIRIENGNKVEADGTMEDVIGMSMFDIRGGIGIEEGAFSATASALHAQCTTYGMAWVTASGGTEPYTYEWNTGETTESITDLTAGIYQVTVTDADGASKVITLTVEGQYLPIYDGNGNLIDCIDNTCPTLLTPGGLVPDGYRLQSRRNNHPQ